MRYCLSLVLVALWCGFAQAYQVVILGNSITLSAPQPEIGWTANHGMAASAPERDYAHRFLKSIGVDPRDAYVRNLYPFETDFLKTDRILGSLSPVFATGPRITVLELGDNARLADSSLPKEFADAYRRLVDAAASRSQHLFCVSTWWQSPVKDRLIRESCEAKGGVYVFIGDLQAAAKDADSRGPAFKHKGVDAHPKDAAMGMIAQRLREALGAADLH